MRPAKHALLALAASLLCPAGAAQRTLEKPAQKQEIRATEHPFLWRIETEPPSYLYGTIHVPDPRVLRLPQIVEEARNAADAVITEVPMSGALQVEMTKHMYLPRGETLQDHLPPAVYGRIAKFIESKGLPMQTFDRMRPWAVMIQLPLLEDVKKMQGRPLDIVLFMEAKRDGKEVGGLETVAEQIRALASPSKEEVVELTTWTLDEMESWSKKGGYLEQMVKLYLAGDADALWAFATDYDHEKEALDKFFKLVIDERNERMVERIVAKMKQDPAKRFFFAVGSLHYPGPKGILALLKGRGYQVTRLRAPRGKRGATRPAKAGRGK